MLANLPKHLQYYYETHAAFIGPEVYDLCKRNQTVTYEEYKRLRLNSYERCIVMYFLDDHALEEVTRYYVQNSSHDLAHAFESPNRTPSTYDQALVGDIIPTLLGRLRTKERRGNEQ